MLNTKKNLILLTLLFGFSQIKAQDKPNVVFVFADDLGWGDLGCYGHPYAKTPALDKLASQGLRFERFYVTGVTCCPSRTGIMTSRHPAGYPKYMAKHGFAGNTTVTELFKEEGYTTGHFGKWHIGPDTKKNPVQDGTYGIDEIDVIGGNKESSGGRDLDLFEAATRFIEENKDKPFYVNIWGHITHYPVDPVDAVVDPFRNVQVNRADFGEHMQEKFDESEKLGGDIQESMRNYLGDVYSLDFQVGKLMNKLDELGIADNTIVIFSSDHGPAPVYIKRHAEDGLHNIKGENTGVVPSTNMLGYAGGFRGGKHTQYEGGVRSPLIVRWPGHVPENMVNKTSIVSGMDYLPTLCALVGIEIDSEEFEGENMADVWQGSYRQRNSALYWRASSANANPSMLDVNWKLHRERGKYFLYDISVDEKELHNVADKYPEVLKKLIAKMSAWEATLPDSYVK